VNFIGNTDNSYKNPVCISLFFQPLLAFEWVNSTVQYNSGGSLTSLINPAFVCLENLILSNNSAKRTSAGVRLVTDSGKLKVRNVSFSRNKGNKGGVIYVSGASARAQPFSLSISTCNFSFNQGTMQGRGLTIDNFLPLSSDSTISDSKFWSNSNNQTGAALFFSCSTGTIEVRNCSFSNNTAKRGSAIYANYRASFASAALLILSDCNFQNNKGGSVVAFVGASNMPGLNSAQLQFSNNTAISVDMTQGVWTDRNSSYIGNLAESGEVARLTPENLITLLNCCVRKNYVRKSSAGLYLTSGSSAQAMDCQSVQI